MRKTNKTHSSFTALVRPHLEPLYRLAYRLTQHREDAQDLVQDVLLKLHPQTDKLAEIKSLAPWLNRVLYNQFVDNQRRYAKRRMRIVEHRDYSADPDIAQAEQASTEDLVEGEYTITRVQAALEQLSDDHRLIINLHDVTLADVIRWNTDLTRISDNVFFVVPEPSSAILSFLGCVGWLVLSNRAGAFQRLADRRSMDGRANDHA